MMRTLPTGTVTLLFTDMQGSTRLLQELGRERYVQELGEHRRLLREAVAAHGGVEVELQGDSFHFAFPDAAAAVLAAARAQRDLAAHAWQARPIRVRMGLHTGEPLQADGLYAGLDVHVAARVMGAAHGGQVLLSETTGGLVAEALPPGLTLRQLGEFRLKDISDAQRLLQLCLDGLPTEFPPLSAPEARPSSLPAFGTPLVGRTRELAELQALLADPAVRLLTLTGPGGIGKTRLALRLAELAGPGFRDGVCFVPLAPVSDPELVLPRIAAALEARERGAGLEETLQQELRERELLLLLDNLEQLLECAPRVAALLEAAPRLRVVCTSRSPLRVRGEREYAVEPLADADAVDLFLARARAHDPGFEAPEAQLAAVARQLDGLPLALELAAARVRVLSAEALLARLEHALSVLTGGARDLPERQRTIRATIEWSTSLLEEREARLLARLSVFAGGFDLPAAEDVAEADLDALTALAEHSLVRRVPGAAEARFSLLHVIREHAREQLAQLGDEATLRARHARLFLELAEQWDAGLRGPDQPEVVRRFDLEADNFRAALAYAAETGDADLELRLAGSLGRYWYLRGLLGEGRRSLDHALARGGGAPARLRALNAAATLARVEGDATRADELATEALGLARAAGDLRSAAKALATLAGSAGSAGDLGRAGALCAESVELFRALGDRHGVAVGLANQGNVALEAGDSAAAVPLLRESVELARGLEDRYALPLALCNLGIATLHERRVDDAVPALRESLAHSVELGWEAGVVEALGGLAAATVLAGDAALGATLVGAVQARREELQLDLGAAERSLQELALAAAAERLGDAEVEEALARGRTLSRDEAVAVVRAAR